MKFILNEDSCYVQDVKNLVAGSVGYYEVEVELDESWDNLFVEARIVKKENGIIQDVGSAISVFNGKMLIDRDISGTYAIGFIGYQLAGDAKIYQISTNLVPVNFDKGAGEIEASNSHDIPTASEWEIYIAELQQFINVANSKIDQANSLDLAVSKSGKTATVEITKKDGTTDSVQIQDGKDGISTIIYYEADDTLTIETIEDAEEVSY